MRIRPKVAAVLLNWNGVAFLGDLFIKSVESVLNIRYENLDVYIVDNGSTDNSIEVLREKFGDSVKLLKLSRNYGYAGAYNFWWKVYRMKYDYTALINNDYLVEPESLNAFIRYLEKHRNVALVQGLNLKLNEKKRILDAGYLVDVYFNVFGRYRDFHVNEYPDTISFITYATGSYVVINNRVIHEDLFIPQLYMYCEDEELGLSLWSKGLKIVTLPIIAGWHKEGGTSKALPYMIYPQIRNTVALRRYYVADPQYKIPPDFRELVTGLGFYVVRGEKLYLRAVFDGLRLRFNIKGRRGPYYPLLLKPTSSKLKKLLFMSLPLKITLLLEEFNKYREEMSKVTIREEQLKTLSKPFLIPVKL